MESGSEALTISWWIIHHLDEIPLPEMVQQIADDATLPCLTFADVLNGLERCGITEATARLRR